MNTFSFRYAPTGETWTGEAPDSDAALILCIRETGWDPKLGIVYLGKNINPDTKAN